MKKDRINDFSLVRECRSWDESRCPHSASITYLINTIYDKNTVALKDTLIKDLNSICDNCEAYQPYGKMSIEIT
jgi:hypothetical protein